MEASRIANVSLALLAPQGRPAASPGSPLARLFEDVFHVGAAPPDPRGGLRDVAWPGPGRDGVRGLAAALAAARSERVIVVGDADARRDAEWLLALVAWPEAAIVLPVADDRAHATSHTAPPSGIYRRAELLGRAEAVLAGGGAAPAFAAFVEGIPVVRVPLARLGLAQAPMSLFAGRTAAPRPRD